MQQQIENPILETVKGAAPKLGLTESALRMKLHRHGLPHVKIGGRVYIELPVVQEWIRQHRVTTTKGPGVAGKMKKIY